VFSVIIGMVFSLARPNTSGVLSLTLAQGIGVVLYACWAGLSNRCLEPRYRSLAVHAVLEAAAAVLRARAEVLSGRHLGSENETEARFGQLREEVRLAELLQKARDVVHPAAQEPGAALDVALLSRVTELREILLTSRLDLELLGHDHAARFVRARLALGLRLLSERLAKLARSQRLGGEVAREQANPLPDLAEAATLVESDDPRLRLLPSIANRLRYLNDEVENVQALLLGETTRGSLMPEELARFVEDGDDFPLEDLLRNFSLESPVLRHALRSSLAFMAVYLLAPMLPWTTRPYWLLLSVAVVLRGTLDDTLTRRNARITGTVLGCMLVTVLVPALPDAWLKVVFVAAVGVSHAFVNVRYLLTAVSATVMALLQAHFGTPLATHLVVERLLDTVLGALLASLFSYVLPSWERRTLPGAVQRALTSLCVYCERALTLGTVSRAEQRLARERAYDALGTLTAALRRSAAEPSRVRPPVAALVALLDHAQHLMAHLSSLQLLLARRAERLPRSETQAAIERARQKIQARLSSSEPTATERGRAPSFGELPSAPIEREPLPWLLRRLEASVHDAGEAGIAARRVLAELAKGREA
jgi:uncharacterized membrane protein YccC